jgi:hypothetical protein
VPIGRVGCAGDARTTAACQDDLFKSRWMSGTGRSAIAAPIRDNGIGIGISTMARAAALRGSAAGEAGICAPI